MKLSRRKCLIWVASLPLVPFASQPVQAAFPALSEQHNQARLYRYRNNARRVRHPRYIDGQRCINCIRFRTLDAWCSLFPEYSVSPSGWCDQWQLKPGASLHSPSAVPSASGSGGYIPLRSIRQNNE